MASAPTRKPRASRLRAESWAERLPHSLTATAWAHTAKHAAIKQQTAAAAYARRAWQLWDAAARRGTPPPWSDELLAWQARAALRLPQADAGRWRLAQGAIEPMSPAEQRDGAWVHWRCP